MKPSIWWIRRDLRLSDNLALMAALGQGGAVIPVFILDPKLLDSNFTSQKRLAFLFAGLCVLSADLRQRGSDLVVRQGDPKQVLHALRSETGAERIFAESDVSPYARHRDEQVGRELHLSLTPGLTVHPPAMLRKADGSPYTVFTPFSRMWHSLPFPGSPLPAPEHLPAVPPVVSLELPELPAQTLDHLSLPARPKPNNVF